jgi:O-antigen/teichoic acid export membrane protein
MNRTERAASGFLTSIALTVIISLSQIMLVPFIISIAGSEILGAYSFIMQLLGIGILVDLGLTVALSRFLSRSYDNERITLDFLEFFDIGKWLLFFINTFTGLILIILGYYLELILDAETDLLASGKLCLYILGIWYLVRTPFQIYLIATISTQNMSKSNLFLIFANFLRILLVIVFLTFGYGLVGMVAGYIFAEFVGMFLHRNWFRKNFKLISKTNRSLNRAKVDDLFSIGFKYWGVNLAQVFGSNSDSLIVGKLLGPKYIAMVYLTKMPALIGTQLIYKISDNAAPAFNEILANSGKQNSYEKLCKVLKITAIFAFPFALGVIIFTDNVLAIWVGRDQYIGIFFAICLGWIVVTQSLSHVYSMALLATGNMKGWGKVTAISAFLRFLSAYFVVKNFGFQLILVPAVITESCVCAWLFLRNCQFFSVKKRVFFKESLNPPLMVSLALVFPFLAVNSVQTDSILISIISLLGISILWSICMFYFCLNQDERLRLVIAVTSKMQFLQHRRSG